MVFILYKFKTKHFQYVCPIFTSHMLKMSQNENIFTLYTANIQQKQNYLQNKSKCAHFENATI